MKELVLRQYVVDAFTDRVFKGNPAAVCVLDTPLADEMMQKIAKENNLSETAFVLMRFLCRKQNRFPSLKLNVAEDPVCGSGHCHVIPLWADKLNKSELCAFQDSARSGVLYCRVENERILLAGKTVLYSVAEIYVQD